MVLKKETTSSSHRGAIELPSSPIWGYALLAIMALFIVFGALLLLGTQSSDISLGDGCVGLVKIDGEIMAQDTPNSLFSTGRGGSEEISSIIEEADARPDIKALLIQINSPGGSVVGSREIYTAVKEAKKPTVAYMREIAASGGYYVAAGADYIVSEPDALTGSIGARMTLSQMSGLFEKVGYNETTIKSGEFKDIGNPAREISPQEIEILNSIINEAYSDFEQAVISQRSGTLNMKLFYENVTDARILTGKQAYKIGLVDMVGSKKDAIEKASKMAGYEKSLRVCEVGAKSTGFFSQLMAGTFELPVGLATNKASIEYR